MSCSRRDFLKEAVGGTLASVLPIGAYVMLSSEEARAAVANRSASVNPSRNLPVSR